MHNETSREAARETASPIAALHLADTEDPKSDEPSLPEVPDSPPAELPRPPQELPPDQTTPHTAPLDPPADPTNPPAIAYQLPTNSVQEARAS